MGHEQEQERNINLEQVILVAAKKVNDQLNQRNIHPGKISLWDE